MLIFSSDGDPKVDLNAKLLIRDLQIVSYNVRLSRLNVA